MHISLPFANTELWSNLPLHVHLPKLMVVTLTQRLLSLADIHQWPEMAGSGWEWPGMAENGFEGSLDPFQRMVGNGIEWLK